MRAWASLRPPVRGSIIVVVVAAVVLVLVGAGKHWIDQAGRVDPGRLPDSAQVVGDEDTVSFMIPGGQVSVGVETDQRTLRDDDDKRYEAPSNGRLVEASWSSESDSETTTEPPAGLEPDKLPDPKVWVKSGEQRERVTGTSEGISGNAHGGAFAFGTRDPLVVEVEFAGRRQSVDVTSGRRTMGSFASLYGARPTARGQDTLRGQRKGDIWWTSTLVVGYDRVPYLHGLGWAKKGREWLVLGRAEYSVDGFEDPDVRKDARYAVADTKPVGSVRVDNGRQVRKPGATAHGGASEVEYEPRGAVFDIPRSKATSLRFTLKFELEGREGPSSESKPLTANRVEPVSAVPAPSGADR